MSITYPSVTHNREQYVQPTFEQIAFSRLAIQQDDKVEHDKFLASVQKTVRPKQVSSAPTFVWHNSVQVNLQLPHSRITFLNQKTVNEKTIVIIIPYFPVKSIFRIGTRTTTV